MNYMAFLLRNVSDKIIKTIKNPSLLEYYIRTYLLCKFDKTRPDIYIISYPKCGRTWIRLMVKDYVSLSFPEKIKKFNNTYKINCINNIVKFDHDLSNWVPAPLGIDRMKFNKKKYKNKKVVFLIRHPGDILVSSWYHLKFRENIYLKDLSEFIKDKHLGINKVIAFFNMWHENRYETEKFMIQTYGEYHKNTEKSLKDLINFIGIETDSEIIYEVINKNKFSRMKKKEQKGLLKEPWLSSSTKNNENSMKARKGKVGEYKKEMSGKDVEFINNEMEKKLSKGLKKYFFNKT